MKCVLHIGLEKTGTTSIQRALSQNRATLNQQGITLGWPENLGNSRYLVAYFRQEPDDYWASRGWQSSEDRLKRLQPLLTDLDEKIRGAAAWAEIMILSSEHFHSRLTDENEIRALATFLRERFEAITIVCFVRPQGSTVLSLYSTALRAGHAVTYRRFAKNMVHDRQYLDHGLTLNKWSEAFPGASISVKPYPLGTDQGRDIRQEFFEAISMAHLFPALALETERANAALSTPQQFFLLMVNLLAKHPLATRITESRRAALVRIIEGAKVLSLLPHRKKPAFAITEEFKESNMQVANQFGINRDYWTEG